MTAMNRGRALHARSRRLWGAIGWELWLPVLMVAIWWLVSSTANNFYAPPLSEILGKAGELWFWEGTVKDVLPSVLRVLAGFAVGTAVGVVIGVLLGLWRSGEDAIRPVLEFVRAIPGVALLPMMMLFLGIGDVMKVAIIAFVCLWPVLLNTIDAIRSVEPVQLQVARSFHMRGWDRLQFIYLPSAGPQTMAGARTGLAMSVIAMLFSEMVGSPGGIGYFILNSERQFQTVDMWAGIVALGVIGYLLNNLFRLAEFFILRWHRLKTAQGKADN